MKARPEPTIVDCPLGHAVSFMTAARHELVVDEVTPRFEPYFCGQWLRVFSGASVSLRMDGRPRELYCGPFAMPKELGDLTVLVDGVAAVDGGLVSTGIAHDARLSILDRGTVWVPPQWLSFPVPSYRWRANVTRTHTWNGFVQAEDNGRFIYYHRGEDLGMHPDRHGLVSMIDGTVLVVPPPGGDGQSNRLVITDGSIDVGYYHMNSRAIRADLGEGARVRRGEVIAKTGNTWNGHLTPDPHLHVGFYRSGSESHVCSFPYLVQAYRDAFPGEILPVAGGFRFCLVGDTIELSAGLSIANGCGGAGCRWLLSDGREAAGDRVRMTYSREGTYSETLLISGAARRLYADVAIVRVSRRPETMADGPRGVPYAGPPFAYVYADPMRGIHPGDAVEFSFHGIGTGAATIDFGNGARERLSGTCHTRYPREGLYLATIRTDDAGNGPGLFVIPVHVEARVP